MDMFFYEPGEEPVPSEQVKIRSLNAEPYQDGHRVAISLEITPFIEKPNIEIEVHNQNGLKVSSFSIVEAIANKMDFTLHLREPEPKGEYTISMQVFYITTDSNPEERPIDPQHFLKNTWIVDTFSTKFRIDIK